MPDTQTIEANGQAPPQMASRAEVEERLTRPLAEGYQPTLPLWALGVGDDPIPQGWFLRDVERMMIHSHIRRCLEIYASGISGAETWGGIDPNLPAEGNPGLPICAENPEAGAFIQKQVSRFWDRGVPRLQKAGYPYGWACGENLFRNEGDGLEWDDLNEFSPVDSFLLTLKNERDADVPVGARITQIRPGAKGKGSVDLWFATEDIPAKALWYTHNPRCHRFYGQSQALGAWKDWKRCATKGGAEMILDAGFFRLGYRAPVIRYPDEDLQVTSPVPGTQMDSQGRPRRPARDMARQIAEQIQAGAAMGMSSKKYPTDQGGDYMWDIQDWGYDFDGSHLIAYVEHLLKRISEGCGTPHEVIEAMEGGGGFSGRNIPVEAWFYVQQQIADAFLTLFCRQVLRPLVRWRFGPVRWSIECKNLLETRRKAQAGGSLTNKPGVDPGMPTQQGTHAGASHHPLAGTNPPPGPQGGAMQPTASDGSMFSVGGITRSQLLARQILAMGRAA